MTAGLGCVESNEACYPQLRDAREDSTHTKNIKLPGGVTVLAEFLVNDMSLAVGADLAEASVTLSAIGDLTAPLLKTLDRLRCGGVVVNAAGQVVRSNLLARQMLASAGNGQGRSLQADELRERLKLLLRGSNTRFRLDLESWNLVERAEKRPLAIHAIPAGDEADPYALTVLILIDLSDHPEPSPTALQRLFKLTAAEAQIAIALSRGESPADIADRRRLSLKTVRAQLASIFAKTQTGRQAELVALLARVALLP